MNRRSLAVWLFAGAVLAGLAGFVLWGEADKDLAERQYDAQSESLGNYVGGRYYAAVDEPKAKRTPSYVAFGAAGTMLLIGMFALVADAPPSSSTPPTKTEATDGPAH